MTKQKKLIIIGVIVALLLAIGGYWYYEQYKNEIIDPSRLTDQGYLPSGADFGLD